MGLTLSWQTESCGGEGGFEPPSPDGLNLISSFQSVFHPTITDKNQPKISASLSSLLSITDVLNSYNRNRHSENYPQPTGRLSPSAYKATCASKRASSFM